MESTRRAEAMRRWNEGEEPGDDSSSGNWGYGYLSNGGHWEFQLPEAFLCAREIGPYRVINLDGEATVEVQFH